MNITAISPLWTVAVPVVRACMPPQVATPKPGPCKGSRRGNRLPRAVTAPSRPAAGGGVGKDALGLAKRITLAPGETFVASESGKMRPGPDEYGMPMALINTPEGPRLLLGEETNGDATRWDPGMESLATLDAAQMRELRDGLDTVATQWASEQDKAQAAGRAYGAAGIAERETLVRRPPTAEEIAERPGVTHGWDSVYDPPLTPQEQEVEAEYGRYVGADLDNPVASGVLTADVGWALTGMDGYDYGQERLFAHMHIGRAQSGGPQFASQAALRGYQARVDNMWQLARRLEAGQPLSARAAGPVQLPLPRSVSHQGPAMNVTAISPLWMVPAPAVRACMPPKVAVPKPGPCPGSRRGVGKRIAKAVAAPAKPAAKRVPKVAAPTRPQAQPRQPPQLPAAPVVGRDVTGELDYTAIRQLAAPVYSSDRRLAAIAEVQGFDGLPQVVTAEQMDQLVAAGNRELWRGVLGGDGRSGAQISEQLRSGPAYFGKGYYGSGIYFTPLRATADRFSRKSASGVVRAVLHPDARTITWEELKERVRTSNESTSARETAQKALFDKMASAPPERYQQAWDEFERDSAALDDAAAHRDWVLADTSRYALAHGYDAITLSEPATDKDPSPQPQVILLNRTALIIQEAVRKRATRSRTAGAGVPACPAAGRDIRAQAITPRSVWPQPSVRACMPPQVAVPKPGPCPGARRGVGKRIRKAVAAPAKPAAAKRKPAKATAGPGPGSGRDLSASLDMEAIAALPRADERGADQRLAAIAAAQGFDALPQPVDEAALDAAVAAGGRRLYRGVKDAKDGSLTAKEIHDAFAQGDVHFGHGIFGNGTYFSNSEHVAAGYADFDYGKVRQAVLPATARTIAYADVLDGMARDRTTTSAQHQAKAADLLAGLARAKTVADMRFAWEIYQGNRFELPALDLLRTDPGAWAMSRGYDAVIVPLNEDGRIQEVVVLNRGALLVDEAASPPTVPQPVADFGTVGRDIVGSLDMNRIGALSKRDSAGADRQLEAIAAQQGFDGPPRVGTAQELDALIAAGGREVFRGTELSQDATRSGEQIAEDFRSGPIFYGTGFSGNGIYVSPDHREALGYAAHNPHAVVRMVLRPGARVADLAEIRRQMDLSIPPDSRARLEALAATQRAVFTPGVHPRDMIADAMRAPRGTLQPQDWLWMDPSTYAAARGYDAVDQPMGGGRVHTALLNRSAVLVQQADRPPRTVQELYDNRDDEFSASVAACLRPGQVHPGPCKGSGTGRKAVKAVARPKSAPKKPEATPTPRDTRFGATGRDLVQRLDMNRIGALPKKDSDGRDRQLTEIARMQGFDGPPRLGTAAELDTLIAAGGRELFRGNAANQAATRSGEQFAEDFRTGPAFYGTGISGGGIYTSTDHREGLVFADGNPNAVIRMVLRPGARVADLSDIRAQMQDSIPTDVRARLSALATRQRGLFTPGMFPAQTIASAMAAPRGTLQPQDWLWMDPSAYAAARGYDAIELPIVGDQSHLTLLNRSAVLAQQAERPPRSAQDRDGDADVSASVAACLKPGEVHPGPCKGSGTARKAVKAVARPKAAPKKPGEAKTPPTGAGRVTGRDITGQLDYGALAQLPAKLASGDEDQRLAAIARAQGFDGPPTLGTAADLDDLIADGGHELFRGTKDYGHTSGDELARQLRTGRAFYGTGEYGPGMYFTPSQEEAFDYADFGQGGINRAVLPRDARIIEYPDLTIMARQAAPEAVERMRAAQQDLIDALHDPAARAGALQTALDVNTAQRVRALAADTSMHAAAKGYDAIRLPGFADSGDDYWIILNRTALTVQDRDRDPSFTAAPPARVQACLPPKVPVPRPGPCPKHGGAIGKTGRRAVAKRRSPAPPPGKTRLDVAGRLDYTDLASKLDGRALFDPAMAEITRRQGFDGPVRRVLDDALADALAAGGVEVWRGHAGHPGVSDEQAAAAFFVGNPRPGLHGSGWGVTTDRQALADLGIPATRMVLPPDADVVDLDELTARAAERDKRAAARQRQLFKELDAANGPTRRQAALRALQSHTARTPARERVLRDPGRYAAALGHDAIRVRRGELPDRYVVVNRSKLLAETPPLTAGAAADECAAEQAEHMVPACMPPTVAVPRPGPCPGTKRGPRKSVGDIAKKAGKTAAKTPEKTPGKTAAKAKRGAPGSGRDLSAMLNMRKIASLPRTTAVGGDGRLSAIAKEQGFDARAALGDTAALDKAIAEGGRPLWRGVRPSDGLTPAQIHDRSATGAARYGKGIYGGGTYFASDPIAARTYGDVNSADWGVRRSVLHRDARTISYPQLLDAMARDTSTTSQRHQKRATALLERLARAKDVADLRFALDQYRGSIFDLTAQDALRTDPGAWAMSRGYDAIIVPVVKDDPYDDDMDEIVVLNRGALLTERPARSRTAAASADPLARVDACMPPTVATPRPGPCPGSKRGKPKTGLPKVGKPGLPKTGRKTKADGPARTPTDATIPKPVAKPQPPGDTPGAGGPPAPPGGRAVGVDYSDNLAALNLDALMALPSNAVGQPSPRLTALGARQGFDALPALGEPKDLDALEKAGGVRMWRGTKSRKDPATGQVTKGRDFARAFRTGDMWYAGDGLRGSGVYATSRVQTAYDKGYSDRGDDLSVNEMVLHPDAKIADYRTLLRQMTAQRTPEQQARIDEYEDAWIAMLNSAREPEARKQAAQQRLDAASAALTTQDKYLSDSSVYAMSKGFDAISHPEAGGETNFVLLNRTALTMLARKGDDRQAVAAAAWLWEPNTMWHAPSAPVQVTACMPPKVARPKPGPCPGARRAGSKLRKVARSAAAPARPRARTEVSTALMLAESVEEVNEVAAAKAKEYTGRDIPFDLGGADVDIARQHAEGILRGLRSFPKARLRAVGTFDSRTDAVHSDKAGYKHSLAITVFGDDGNRILFNRKFIDDPPAYLLALRDSSHGHLSVPTPTGIALHEFGHVLGDDTQGATASKKIVAAMAAQIGVKPSKLTENQVSFYAKKDSGELLAEAFTDVMTRADHASATSAAIFAEVQRRYDARHTSRS